jgi:hypothetical protein
MGISVNRFVHHGPAHSCHPQDLWLLAIWILQGSQLSWTNTVSNIGLLPVCSFLRCRSVVSTSRPSFLSSASSTNALQTFISWPPRAACATYAPPVRKVSSTGTLRVAKPPNGGIISISHECSIDSSFPTDLPPMEPMCFVGTSYGGLLPIEEHRSIMGVVIHLGGTAILWKTRIQRTAMLSSMEAEVITLRRRKRH